MDQGGFDVFIGLVVGKDHHHATALNSERKRLHGKALPQAETALWDVFGHLSVMSRCW